MKTMLIIILTTIIGIVAFWISGYGLLIDELVIQKPGPPSIVDGETLQGNTKVQCKYWLVTETIDMKKPYGSFCERVVKIR